LKGRAPSTAQKKAVDLATKNLGEVIVFILIVFVADIILAFVFGFIPLVGAYIGAVISWIAGIGFTVSSVHFYLLKRSTSHNAPTPPTPTSINLKPPRNATPKIFPHRTL
jgi:uncharacterized protein (DUF697 family)